LGKAPGSYEVIDPVEHANIFQSTNDVIPTSLKVAAMSLLQDLEQTINELRFEMERMEKAGQHFLRIGYTQMQEAVPSSFGKLFSTYSEALSRDWWRVSKCFERIKLVNLGGSAIGTGMAVPRFFIMEVVSNLQKITGLPLARSENLPDSTSNHDSLVEVHATLKAHAVNLEKMVSDLRLLASEIGNPVLRLPQVQVGSSIMPGKINPVIPEFVISAAHKIYANDQLISSLAAQGCLELNAYLPVIGHALLESVKLLIAAGKTLKNNLLIDMKLYPEVSVTRLMRSPSITTALNPVIGYHKASEIARYMKDHQVDLVQANLALGILPGDKLLKLVEPENLLKLGFVLGDLDES
jgi:aspartate ammonia-lyase